MPTTEQWGPRRVGKSAAAVPVAPTRPVGMPTMFAKESAQSAATSTFTVVVTGAGTRAFAAGADIGEMAGEDAAGLEAGGRFDGWDALARLPMPTTRVVPAGDTLGAVLWLAATIAAMPPLAVRAAERAVTRAHEIPLSDGLRVERQLFYRLFGTEDKAEGMAAFLEKRSPAWKGR